MDPQKPSPRRPSAANPPQGGPEPALTRVEEWIEGLTIVQVDDFVDATGRWRQLTLSDGHLVQIRFTHPWLILEPDPADRTPET